jgi:ribosomal protein S18 acetylase RimI-like enzyme
MAIIEYLAPPLDWPDPVFGGAEAAKQLAVPGTHLWAVPHNGTAAVLLARLIPGEVAEVLTLFVRKGERRQGHALALMRTLLAEARKRGCPAVFLEVRAGNEPARRLYAALRFGEVGRRIGYYSNPREDAVVLRRELR